MRFTIITVCKNDYEGLKRTSQSLWNQTFEDWEHVIVDGCSIDGTLAFIDDNRDKFAQVIAEPDDGIYQAMNKGIALARGDYLLFLNAGDIFFHENVLKLVHLGAGNVDLLYGGALVLNYDTGKLFVKNHEGYDKVRLMVSTICHQAIFAHKSVFDRVGVFDEAFRLCADQDWLIRVFSDCKLQTKRLPFPVITYYNSGLSRKNPELRKGERIAVRRKYCGSLFVSIIELIHVRFPLLLLSKKIRALLALIIKL